MLQIAGQIQNFQVTICIIIVKRMGNFFTILGKFSLFLNWKGACIWSHIWPRKIPDSNMIHL